MEESVPHINERVLVDVRVPESVRSAIVVVIVQRHVVVVQVALIV